MPFKPSYLMICLFLPSSLFSYSINASEDIEKVEVIGKRNQAYSEPSIETKKLLEVAGIDGDPLQALFSLPGVVYAGGDDGGEPAIRGSSPDDNAFYIDSMPADYIFHLFGDSIFNKNLLRDVDLHAAAFSSEYGNATGGVFDVKLRDPRSQPIEVKLDASLLKTGVMIEGSTFDNQAFYFSYRRSLIHLFLAEGDEDEGLTIFDAPVSDDYQGKYQWRIGNNHKLTFSVNGASDQGGVNISKASEEGRINPDFIGDLSIHAQFDSQGIQWQWFPHQDDTFNVSVNHVLSKSGEKHGAGQFVTTENDEYNLRLSAHTKRLDNHTLGLGLDIQSNDFTYSFDTIPYFCTDHDTNCNEQKGERIQGNDNIKANVYGLYVSDLWRVSPEFNLELGIRADYDDYTKENFIHPRATATWFVDQDISIFAKAGTYSRFPDVNTALKLLGNPNIKPLEATHVSGGMQWHINHEWRTKAEVYYKDLTNFARAVALDEPNAELRYTNDVSGSAKGIEWLLEKDLTDDWYGWLSISWSESERTDDLTKVSTEYYLDTPWVINSVVNYQLNDKWDIGMRFTARSGAKYTPITGIRVNPDFTDNYLATYGELNSQTLPTYSRLDIQAKYQYQLFGKEAAWTFALLNALASDNISGYYFKPDGNETPDNFEIEQEEGIGIFPSIGFEVSF